MPVNSVSPCGQDGIAGMGRAKSKTPRVGLHPRNISHRQIDITKLRDDCQIDKYDHARFIDRFYLLCNVVFLCMYCV